MDDLLSGSENQRPRLHQAQHRENVVHARDDFRLESGDVERFLEPGVGGEPFCQRDEFLIFIITQVGQLAGVEGRRRGCGKENIVVEQGKHFKTVTIDIAFGNGD